MTPRSWVPNVPISTERDINNIRRVTTTNNYLWRCFHTRCTPDARTRRHSSLPFVWQQTRRMLRVLLRFTSYSSLYFSTQSIATFDITYKCLVEVELHREIYHFTHERQTLKLDSNQHPAIYRGSTIELLSDEVPVTLAKLSDVRTDWKNYPRHAW